MTQAGSQSSAGAQATAAEQAKNVKASKETAKMSTADKNKAIKDVNKQMVNPDNPSGSVATTAASQKANVDASKGTPKANVELKTKEGQKALDKDLKGSRRRNRHPYGSPERQGARVLPFLFEGFRRRIPLVAVRRANLRKSTPMCNYAVRRAPRSPRWHETAGLVTIAHE